MNDGCKYMCGLPLVVHSFTSPPTISDDLHPIVFPPPPSFVCVCVPPPLPPPINHPVPSTPLPPTPHTPSPTRVASPLPVTPPHSKVLDLVRPNGPRRDPRLPSRLLQLLRRRRPAPPPGAWRAPGATPAAAAAAAAAAEACAQGASGHGGAWLARWREVARSRHASTSLHTVLYCGARRAFVLLRQGRRPDSVGPHHEYLVSNGGQQRRQGAKGRGGAGLKLIRRLAMRDNPYVYPCIPSLLPPPPSPSYDTVLLLTSPILYHCSPLSSLTPSF